MFNRALQVRVIKSDKAEVATTDQTDAHFEGKAAIIGHYLDKTVGKIGKALITYVVLDTVRQVLVARASRN